MTAYIEVSLFPYSLYCTGIASFITKFGYFADSEFADSDYINPNIVLQCFSRYNLCSFNLSSQG